MSEQRHSRLGTVFPDLGNRRLSTLRRQEVASCCDRLGLDSSGNRHALLARLSAALQAGAQIPPISSGPPTSGSNSVATATSVARTPLVPPTNLLPPTLTQVGLQQVPIPPVSLAPSTSSATPNPSWIYTVAQQAAQSAISQALALQPATAQLAPSITPTVQLAATAQPIGAPPALTTTTPPSAAVGPSTSQPAAAISTLPTLPTLPLVLQLP